MNFLNIDARKIALFIGIIAIPLLTINMERNPEESHWAFKPFAFALGSLQSVYSDFSSGVRGTTSLYLNLIGIKKENERLLKENAELRAQLGALTELEKENQRLNSLLGFQQKSPMELVATKVIGKDLLPNHHTLTINRGTHHGIAKHMAALTVGGVVGYVYKTSMLTSQVLLLTDPYSAIDSIVQRSRARGIVEGSQKDQCKLRYLKREDDVNVGDLVVTSGLNNIFPKGFPIAKVKNVLKSQYGLSQDVELEPVINPQTLEEIFVVLKSNSADYTPSEEPPAEPEGEPSQAETETTMKSATADPSPAESASLQSEPSNP
ncbi:MAG: rod shape-determining protein MreC [Bdellovibrionales bacterium]|nr:rod shape-determining protein MreC [Bdellovibrionales bacterium]